MAIETQNVTVKFKNGVIAVNNLSIKIEKGVYGLLGENGAGKTTLMRVFTTIIKPTYGQVILNGIDYNNKNYHEITGNIGYLPQELDLYPNLTVGETLEYLGGLSGLSKSDCKKQIKYYLEKTNLEIHQKKKNRQLSGGMKRRVGLIQAMLHEPEVLIVDEPTTGLDPEERIRIRNLLVEFSKDRIVLFSTHVVEDLVSTCNLIGIMKKGSLVYNGSVSALLSQTKGHVWLYKLKDESELSQLNSNYIISSKQYTEDGLLLRILSDSKPDLNCDIVSASLEDAYIYLVNKYPI